MNDPDDVAAGRLSAIALAQEVERLRRALDGARAQIGIMHGAMTRAGLAPPAGDATWWEPAGMGVPAVAPETVAQSESARSDYFGMQGMWVPGQVTEVNDLDELLLSLGQEAQEAVQTPSIGAPTEGNRSISGAGEPDQ